MADGVHAELKLLAMTRAIMVTIRALLVIGAALGAYRLYSSLEIWIPASTHGGMPSILAWETGVLALIASLIAVFSVKLFGRFAYGAAALICLPIVRQLWPWNSVYHDIAWTRMHWAVSVYELFSFLALVALLTHVGMLCLRRPWFTRN